MQEADEQDTCRICSAPAEPGLPLFHPCKCSGTIRYIHQDCLTTWLAHSKKKNCDVCKHPYSFTKVYAPDMPSTLPPVLLVRRLIQQALFAILFGFRAMAVAVIWLAVLPWATVWTWRMYFSMGDSTAWWISDRERPLTDVEPVNPLYQNIPANASVPHPSSFIARVTTHPVWFALSADIFTGQIIASLIVLTFVAIFLLREWISQNARPGVFEDEELLPEDQAGLQVEEHLLVPEPGPVQPPQLQALHREQIQVGGVRDYDVVQAHEGANGHVVDGGEHRHGQSPIQRHRAKGKGRQDSIDQLDRVDSELPARSRRRLQSASADEGVALRSRAQRRSFARRAHAARIASSRRRAIFTASNSPSLSPTPALPSNDTLQEKFEFTFKASSDDHFLRRSLSEPSHKGSFVDTYAHPGRIFPAVTLEPPRASIPFSFKQAAFLSDDEWALIDPQLTRASRPPLPATTFSVPTPTSVILSPGGTPESPRLATYRAPEELEPEAGPSSSGYRNKKRANVEDDDDDDDYVTKSGVDPKLEHRKYFIDPEQEENEEIRDAGSSTTASDIDSGSVSGGPYLHGHDDDGGERADDGDDEEDGEEEMDIFEDEIPWEDVDGEDDEVVAALGGQAADREPEVNQLQPGPANPDVGPDGNDELDGNVEDDMEGAMEAIGMRGPIYGVIQNAALMIFVLDTAIGLGIWVPFTIGKSAALLSLDPQRFLQILHLPIRAMRIITDPVVDSVALVIMSFVLPPWLRLARSSLALFLYLVRKVFGSSRADSTVRFFASTYAGASNISDRPFGQILSWSSWTSGSLETTSASSPSSSSFVDKTVFNIIETAEPYLATFGREVRLGAVQAQATWTRLALGQGPSERAFAVILGYAVVGLLLSLYLNLLTVGNAKTAGRAVRSAVRQQLLVLKVAAFIFIELVTFPLGCGVVLDLCTVWLFPEADLMSRAAFFFRAPLTAMFYHWVAGTMFMYSFAILLSGCRSVMRPGAMWFIKDPQDQNSHPIRDILDRPTLTQLRKICVSGLMYSFVVACVVGSVAGLLLLGSKSIMPFRWKNREPLSNVPIDLLFLHLVLPYTMHYFRPRKGIRKLATGLWKFLAARLRLTSYFFGDRHYNEESTSRHWKRIFSRYSEELVELDAVPDGSFRRVPATDNLALPRDMRATAAVTADGQPVDDASRELMEMQNGEAEKAKRNVKDDYMIVYLPPHFRYRVICFIALLWVIGAISLGVTIALPIQLGRSFFHLFTPRELHDGYSLIVGFYLLWACYLMGRAIDRLDKRRQRTGVEGPRADLRILVVKRGLLWVAKAAYMAVFLGVVIPTLIAFVVDLYIILPVRFALDPELTPRIRVVDTWALGLLYTKIALHINRVQPPNQIATGLQHIINNGWTHPDPVKATKQVIVPLIVGMLGMIFLPGAVIRALQYIVPTLAVDDKFIFMHIYPGIFMLAGLIRSATVLYDLLSSWSQSIRDKEFLVEMRLRNHEPENVKEKPEVTEGVVRRVD